MKQPNLILQPRLRLLADLVPRGARLADVGTDHGYLPVWLLREGRIVCAIASDIHEAPLEHARRTALTYGITHGLTFRLCAGLEGYSAAEADTIVIAGMGGETIAAILDAAPWTKESGVLLLLQPMTKAEMLRKWIYGKGYHLIDERLVRDKNYLYPIFCAAGGGGGAISDAEACGGLLLARDPLWGAYLSQQMKRLQIRIDGLLRGDREADRKEIERLQELYQALAARKESLHDNNKGH